MSNLEEGVRALMTEELEKGVRAWIGEGRDFTYMAGDCLVRLAGGLIRAFYADYPEHCIATEADCPHEAVVETFAKVCGFEGAMKFLGSAKIASDGNMTLKMAPTDV